MLLQRRGRRGATLVEFALSWTIFFFITVVGIMDLGRGIWAYNALAHMAHEADAFRHCAGGRQYKPRHYDRHRDLRRDAGSFFRTGSDGNNELFRPCRQPDPP